MAVAAVSRNIGRYRLNKKLFRDDTGTVYIARHTQLGRNVTVKLIRIPNELASETWAEIQSRFLRETQAAGRLRHPNILSVWDAGEEDQFLYIVMDYVPGDRLDAFTDPDHLLPVTTVLHLGSQLARALDYAHQQRVVHRDIKPTNIIFDPGNRGAILTGFGVARMLDSSRTKTGTVRGSPSFMSPEQVVGAKVTATSDIYSLGVTLYQLCTGWLPYVGNSIPDLMRKIVDGVPRKVHDVRAEVPMCVVQIIEKALAKDPGARYQRGADLAAALDACAQQLTGATGE